MMYTKGPEVRALFLVKVEEKTENDLIEAATKLFHHVVHQQWRLDWSIRRVDIISLEESRKLPHKFAPTKETEFNLSIAVKAARHDILANEAFPTITKALGIPDPEGLILIGSLGADW